MSATYPQREGSHFDESRIDSELEHQLRLRNVALADRETPHSSSGAPGDVAGSGPAPGDYLSTGASTAHALDHQHQHDHDHDQQTPTPTVPLPEHEQRLEQDAPSFAAVARAAGADHATAPAAPSAPDVLAEPVEAKPLPEREGEREEPLTQAQPGATEDSEEGKERSCRICFGGVDEEGEMGRLISPCLCSGSMRYVHVQCLAMWRGKNSKTFLECPQCKYAYVLRRGRWGDLILSSRVLSVVTATTFISMSLVTGHFLLHFLLNLYQKGSHSSSAVGSTWESEDGTMVVYMGGATFILDLIDDSINAFIAITARAFDMFEGSRWVSPLMLDLILRFLLGVALLGALSALSLLGSLRLLAPLQLLYTISLSGVVDLAPVLGVLGGSRNVIVGFVLLGMANSAVQVYDALHACALFALRFVESEIVEPTRDRAAQRLEHRSWGRRWLQERKWRSVDGWREVYTRTREKYKRNAPQPDPGREVLVQMAAQAQAQEQPQPQPQPQPQQPQPGAAAPQPVADLPGEHLAPVAEPADAAAPDGEAPAAPGHPDELGVGAGVGARPDVQVLGQ